MKLDSIISNFKDYHLPILVLMFVVGTVEHHLKGLDTSFVAFAATIVTGITGHAFSPAQQDKPEVTPDAKG